MRERVCKSFGRTDHYTTLLVTEFGECERLSRIELDEGYYLWEIQADYRKKNPVMPVYYVVAETKSQARERFSDLISWLAVYSVRKCSDEEAHNILDNYGNRNMIVI